MIVDHRDDQAVAALFDRVRDEHGGLDLLVANACSGKALPGRAARAQLHDCGVSRHADRTRPVAELAAEYRFTDIEEQPPAGDVSACAETTGGLQAGDRDPVESR